MLTNYRDFFGAASRSFERKTRKSSISLVVTLYSSVQILNSTFSACASCSICLIVTGEIIKYSMT